MLMKHFPAVLRQVPGRVEGAEPLKIFEKNESFCCIFQQSEGRALAAGGQRQGADQPLENFDKNVCF